MAVIAPWLSRYRTRPKLTWSTIAFSASRWSRRSSVVRICSPPPSHACWPYFFCTCSLIQFTNVLAPRTCLVGTNMGAGGLRSTAYVSSACSCVILWVRTIAFRTASCRILAWSQCANGLLYSGLWGMPASIDAWASVRSFVSTWK